MEQNQNKLQAALRALEVGKQVINAVEALSPHIKASGDLESIQTEASCMYNTITGVVGGAIDYKTDGDKPIDANQMEETIRKQVESSERGSLQIPNYSVSKETASLIACIEELDTLHGHIYEALSLSYDPLLQIDKGVVGKELFEALCKVQTELYSFVVQSIKETLSPLSRGTEI